MSTSSYNKAYFIEYEAKVKAEKERDLAQAICEVDTMRRRAMARTEDPMIAGMIHRGILRKYRIIEEERRAYNISEERIMDIVRSLDPVSEAIRQSFDQAAVTRRRPASKASIKALEKFVPEDGDASLMCVICREEMTTACTVVRMPCSHMFHNGCIVQRLVDVYNNRCPLCMFNMPERKN